MLRIMKICVLYFLILINYILLYSKKFVRLFNRFINRLLQTWYIGFVVIIFYGFLTYGFISLKLTNDFLKFFPSMLSTLLTIHLIDFLRLEYERRRDVNKRYLFNRQLEDMKTTLEFGLVDIFNEKIENININFLDQILEDELFWFQEIEIIEDLTMDKIKVIRYEYLFDILKNINRECYHCISSYLFLASYKEFKFLHNFKFYTGRGDGSNSHKQIIAGLDSLYISWLIEYCQEIEDIFSYWNRDIKLEESINHAKYDINVILGKEV